MSGTWKHAYSEENKSYRVSNNYGFLRITRANKQYPCGRWGYCDQDSDGQILRGNYYVSLVSGWKATRVRPTGEIAGYREGSAVEGQTKVEVSKARIRRFHLRCVSPWIEWVASQLAEKPRGRQRTYSDEERKDRRKLIDRRKYIFRMIATETSLWTIAQLLQEAEVLNQRLDNRFNLRQDNPQYRVIAAKITALRCNSRNEGYPYCVPDHEGRCMHCGGWLNVLHSGQDDSRSPGGL